MKMDETQASERLFRPRKRRRVVPRRVREDEEEEELENKDNITNDEVKTVGSSTTGEPEGAKMMPPEEPQEPKQPTLSVAEIVRQIKMNRSRGRRGIDFTAPDAKDRSVSRVHEGADSSAVTANKESASQTFAKKFVHSNSQISGGSEDQLDAIVEAQLARWAAGVEKSEKGLSSDIQHGAPELSQREVNNTTRPGQERQPASLGQLQEIDLGPDSTMKNIARTTEATKQKLRDGTDPSGVSKPVTGGITGKSENEKNVTRKNIRSSDDLKRDKIVEQVFSEAKIDLYDDPNEEAYNSKDDQAADDRVAEEFRRAFMDAVQSRNYAKKPPPTNSTRGKGAKQEQSAKGPKLGGSRSARAQMRAQDDKTGKKR